MKLRSLILVPLSFTFVMNTAQSTEVKLTGEEIRNHLDGNFVVHRKGGKPQFRQSFAKDGSTQYQSVGREAEHGKWSVQGNQYCSKWGPFGWTCYDMTAEGDQITWITKDGTRFSGKIITK